MTSLSSCPAICKLSVSNTVLENDTVLHLITLLASEKQLKVVKVKNGSGMKLQLSENGSIELSQRASILRSLAGPALHYTLDDTLLGGYGSSSKNSGSMKSCLALSALQNWMSVTEHLKSGELNSGTLLSDLELYLETNCFLIPSSRATLADMDMCCALLNRNSDGTFSQNVHRWLKTVHSQMVTLGATNLPPFVDKLPSIPSLFWGMEDFVLASKSSLNGKGDDAITKVKNAPILSEEQKKAAAEKRAKKNAAKASKNKKPATAPLVDLNISALDIRVGVINKAWHHESAEKLFCEEIDLGEESPRQIASGLRPFYQTEELVNRRVLVVCNLKSRPLLGFPSHGMVLCASNNDHTKVEFVVPPPDAPIGERVTFGDLQGDPQPENKVAKKKMLEKLLPDLRTDETGVVYWKDHQAKTSKGVVRAVNNMGNAHVG